MWLCLWCFDNQSFDALLLALYFPIKMNEEKGKDLEEDKLIWFVLILFDCMKMRNIIEYLEYGWLLNDLYL
jgi:hypothetical protein